MLEFLHSMCSELSAPGDGRDSAVQILEFVGSSGNSSGPTFIRDPHRCPARSSADNSNAIDPIPFLRSVGVQLGTPTE